MIHGFGGGARRRAPSGAVAAMFGFALLASACGCEPTRDASESRAPTPIPISVLADSSGATRLSVVAPDSGAGARAWLARVRVADVARAAPPEPPLPDAAPEAPPARPGPPLEVDPGLKPPIPRSAVPLVIPPSGAPRGASVSLDVLVDESGAVGDVVFAGGSDDPALIDAAIACARRMTFLPALRAGRPVAVWCRQRFDFDARRAGP